MKKSSLPNVILLFILFGIISLTTTSCKKDIEDCTDPNALNFNPDADADNGSCIYLRDKVIGEWDAVKLFFDDDNLIALGLFNTIKLEFEADGDFEWAGIPNDGDTFNGSGDWEVDNNFLEIEFNADSDTFCGDADHRFSIDFDGDDELNLEDRCNDGTNMRIELDRD